MGRADSTSLAPGFRFHPTDEELVRYYLKRKVTNKPLRFDAISVIDIYKSEPWDLPSKSKLKSRDLEWYFFSVLDRKYANGSKTNRATEKGYWKTTGKDRAIKCNSQIVGMKKTLVYHQGRAPRGERSNWVMHEYRLSDEQLEKDGIVQDAFVLCRIFQKSGTGPKNGEQYGAPFVEEDWDDEEEVVWIPDGESVGGILVTDEVAAVDNGYVENNDFDQNFDITVAADNAPVPWSFYYGETSNNVQYRQNLSGDDQKPIIGNGERHYDANLADNQYLLHSPGQYGMNTVNSVKEEEYVTEPSNNEDAVNNNFLLDEPYLDAVENPEFGEGLFLEANDLSNPVQPNAEDSGLDMVEEYLNFFDVNDDNLTFDPSELVGGEKDVDDQEKGVPGGSIEVSVESQKLADVNSDSMESQTSANINSDWPASSSKQKPETISFESDIKYPFLKQASHMLGSIPAPPAFASEFPAKDAALRLRAGQSSGSVHVTAGIIRIENTILNGSGIDWSFSKNGNVNIILSFSLPQGDVCPPGLVPMANYFSGKMGSVVSRSWFLLMFFWILIVSVTYKMGTCVCTK